MKLALGQFRVRPTGEENHALCRSLIDRAQSKDAALLLLPEGIIARRTGDPDWSRAHAETLDGPFVTGLLQATRGKSLCVVGTVHIRVPGQKRVRNDLIVARDGRMEVVYTKLHLYDAFASRESDFVTAGKSVAPVIDIGGMRVGFMTCYDLRFPELARRLALDGATLIAVPAAWVKGPLKEEHRDLCVRARALENTCWVAAVSECGPENIGRSKVADPLGVVRLEAHTDETLLFADIDPQAVQNARKALPVLANRRFAPPILI